MKKHTIEFIVINLLLADSKSILIQWLKRHQLGQRYEGQLMSDGGAYSPFRSILLVLTHDFIITCVYGPTGSDGHEQFLKNKSRSFVIHRY